MLRLEPKDKSEITHPWAGEVNRGQIREVLEFTCWNLDFFMRATGIGPFSSPSESLKHLFWNLSYVFPHIFILTFLGSYLLSYFSEALCPFPTCYFFWVTCHTHLLGFSRLYLASALVNWLRGISRSLN